MANGWVADGAVQEQIDASIKDAIKLARDKLPQGKSLSHCENCQVAIPLARQQAIVGTRVCVDCQARLDQ